MIPKAKIERIIKEETFGVRDPITSIRLKIIGMGENHQSVLAVVNGKHKFVFRIALENQAGQRLNREATWLNKIPPGFGPKVFHVDTSRKILQQPFSVIEYVEGTPPNTLSKKQLTTHARKLAQFHNLKQKKTSNTIHTRLKHAIIFLAKRSTIPKALLRKVQNFIKENKTLFKKSKSTLIHGDLCLTNMLFTQNMVNYIDWELIGYGDPAEDIARMYYEDCACPPWSMQLSGKKLEYFLKEYLELRKDPAIRERVKIWSIYLKFTDLVYFQGKLKQYKKSKDQIKKRAFLNAVNVLGSSLNKQFKVH